MELDCIPGYSLSGSRVITCVKNRNWEYETTPECVLGRCINGDIIKEGLAEKADQLILAQEVRIQSSFGACCLRAP